jgi:hypothetical protein
MMIDTAKCGKLDSPRSAAKICWCSSPWLLSYTHFPGNSVYIYIYICIYIYVYIYIYIYGKIEKNFNSLKKEYFHALTISSVQELYKIIMEQKEEINN